MWFYLLDTNIHTVLNSFLSSCYLVEHSLRSTSSNLACCSPCAVSAARSIRKQWVWSSLIRPLLQGCHGGRGRGLTPYGWPKPCSLPRGDEQACSWSEHRVWIRERKEEADSEKKTHEHKSRQYSVRKFKLCTLLFLDVLFALQKNIYIHLFACIQNSDAALVVH